MPRRHLPFVLSGLFALWLGGLLPARLALAASGFATDLYATKAHAALWVQAPAPVLDAEQRAWIAAALGGEPHCVTPANHGFNSCHAWLVELDGRRYFYKQLPYLAGEGGQKGVQEAVWANQEAERLGFGPQVVAADAERGALLLAYVAGEVGAPTPDSVARFRLPVLRTLRQFHAATATGTTAANDAAGHHASCATLEVQALLVPGVDVASVAAAAAACHVWSARIEQMQRPLSRVHNDLNPKNLVCTHGVVHLLDWDTLQWGDPLQDLALYAFEHQLDVEKMPALLMDYQGDTGGLERLQLYLARLHARRFLTLTRGMPWDDLSQRAANLAYVGEQLAKDAVVLAR